ncbi:MAG: porin [Flavobacteriaceae bacterium]
MNNKLTLPVLLALMVTFFAQGQEITENKFGNGILNIVAKDSSYSMVFGARFQSLFIGQWEYPEYESLSNGNSNFLIRRARLKFDGFAYSPKLVYKIELGLSNRDISGGSEFTANSPRVIYDAVLKWNFHENFVLWGGQAKLPGNRERVVSSGNMETVDRSLVNSRFNIDRDMGIQLHHHINLGGGFIIKEALAFSQGEGRNITTGNLGGYQYTARLEALPFGKFDDYVGADLKRWQTPKLGVGITYDFNDDAVKTRSNQGSYMVTDAGFHQSDISTLFVDAMFKYRGWSFMGEYAHRTADDAVALNTDGTPTGDVVTTGDGLNLQTGYLFKNNIQVTGRYTDINLDNDIAFQAAEKQYTLGLSKYFVGHKLKIQTDLSLNDYKDDSLNRITYRLQFDIHF